MEAHLLGMHEEVMQLRVKLQVKEIIMVKLVQHIRVNIGFFLIPDTEFNFQNNIC